MANQAGPPAHVLSNRLLGRLRGRQPKADRSPSRDRQAQAWCRRLRGRGSAETRLFPPGRGPFAIDRFGERLRNRDGKHRARERVRPLCRHVQPSLVQSLSRAAGRRDGSVPHRTAAIRIQAQRAHPRSLRELFGDPAVTGPADRGLQRPAHDRRENVPVAPDDARSGGGRKPCPTPTSSCHTCWGPIENP